MSGSASGEASSPQEPGTPIIGVKGTRDERGGGSKGESPEDVKRKADAKGHVRIAEPAGVIEFSAQAPETVVDVEVEDEFVVNAFQDDQGVFNDIVDALESAYGVEIHETPPAVGADDDEATFELDPDSATTVEDVDDTPPPAEKEEHDEVDATNKRRKRVYVPTKRHAEIYGEIDKEALARAAEQCQAALADGKNMDDSAHARQRVFRSLVSALCALITAFGCLFTYPTIPGDYAFNDPLPFIMGHFMTSNIGLDRTNLKATRTIKTKDGDTVEACISRCWNVWRRAVGAEFWDTVGLWNCVPFEAHGSAGGDVYSQKGKPLITREMRSCPEFWLVDVMVEAIMRCFRFTAVCTMGGAAREWVEKRRVDLQKLVVEGGQICTLSAHACFLLDRAFLGRKGKSTAYTSNRVAASAYHYYNFGRAVGVLLGDQARGEEAGRRFLARQETKYGVKVEGEFVLFTPEQQRDRQRELRRSWWLSRNVDHFAKWTYKRMASELGFLTRNIVNPSHWCLWTVGRCASERKFLLYDIANPSHWCLWTVGRAHNEGVAIRRKFIDTTNWALWSTHRLYVNTQWLCAHLSDQDSFAKWTERRTKNEKRIITRMLIDIRHWARWSTQRAEYEPYTLIRYLTRSDHWALWKESRHELEMRWVRLRCGDGLHWAKWTKRRETTERDWMMIRMVRVNEHWCKWTKKRNTQEAAYIRDRLPMCDHWCKWTKYRAKQQRDQLAAKLRKRATRAH